MDRLLVLRGVAWGFKTVSWCAADGNPASSAFRLRYAVRQLPTSSCAHSHISDAVGLPFDLLKSMVPHIYFSTPGTLVNWLTAMPTLVSLSTCTGSSPSVPRACRALNHFCCSSAYTTQAGMCLRSRRVRCTKLPLTIDYRQDDRRESLQPI